MKLLSSISSFLKNFIQFGIAGLLGAFTGFLTYFILVDYQKQLSQNQGFAVAFLISVTTNFFVHFYWTFRKKERQKITVVKYLSFITISLVGLAINFSCFKIILKTFTFPLIQEYSSIATLFSTGISAVFNYFFSPRLVFLLKKKL